MIVPTVPVWLYLLFLALAALAALVAIAVVVRFLLGVVKLIFGDDDANPRETYFLGAVILLALGGYWFETADRRAAENRLDALVALSVVDADVAGRSIDVEHPCGGTVARGPAIPGNEGVILDAITQDAANFENDGWRVQRLLNASDRRATLYLQLSPRAFVARRDQLLVTAQIEKDRYVYRLYDGDCEKPESIGAPFVDEVERFPPVPDLDEAPDPQQIVGLVERNRPRHARQVDISEPIIQGLGTDVDCFVATGTWGVNEASDRRELLASIANSLQHDGWTVQREEQVEIPHQPDVRFIARRGHEVIDGSTSRDGVTLTEFPPGCARIGPHPQPLQHFEIVEAFTQPLG